MKKVAKRSAQEIANSMKGAGDLTTTGVKLDRIRRSLPHSKPSDPFPGWLKAASDSEDTDTLPEVSEVLAKFKSKALAKRSRDASPEREQEEVTVKKYKAGTPESVEPAAESKTLNKMPRLRSLTVMESTPEPVSPQRFKKNIMSSPPSPSPPSRKPVTVLQKPVKKKQPLFRPPSVENNPYILDEAERSSDDTEETEDEEEDDELTETSSVDELEDTGAWMDKNVEVVEG